jgi:hypothetical protein
MGVLVGGPCLVAAQVPPPGRPPTPPGRPPRFPPRVPPSDLPPSDRPPPPPDAPQGEAPGAWAKRFDVHHAKGRLFLSTYVPITVGGLAVRVGTAGPDTPLARGAVLGGLCATAAGVVVGPSMGLWCTGQPTTAWLSLGVRAVGVGGLGVAAWRAVADTRGTGLAGAAVTPVLFFVYALPGLVVTATGIGWAAAATPDRRCRGHERARLELTPRTDALHGHGLGLTLRW